MSKNTNPTNLELQLSMLISMILTLLNAKNRHSSLPHSTVKPTPVKKDTFSAKTEKQTKHAQLFQKHTHRNSDHRHLGGNRSFQH